MIGLETQLYIYTAFDDIVHLTINKFMEYYYINCDLYPDISESFACTKTVLIESLLYHHIFLFYSRSICTSHS